MFKAKEGINIGGKVVTGSGPTAVLTVGDVGTLAYQNAEGATVDNMIVVDKLGVGYGVEAPTYDFDIIKSKPAGQLVGRMYNKSTTGGTKTIFQLGTGSANNYVNFEWWDGTGALITLGTGAPTLYVNATTHQIRTQAASNILQIIDGQLTLQNATSNKIKFGVAGVAAPTFTTYSNGVKLVLYDSLNASDVGYTLGIESSNMFFTCATAAMGFKWYGGTSVAMTLSGAGAMSLTNNLTVQGGNISVGNVAATLCGGNTNTSISIGSGLTSGNVTIGTTTTTGTTYIQGVTGMKIPLGTTAQQPVAATAGSGTIRYNTTDNVFEGVLGGSPAWANFVTNPIPSTTTATTQTADNNSTALATTAFVKSQFQSVSETSVSSTAVDITGIPSWVKRVYVLLNGVSSNSTSSFLLQLGTSGGFQTTSYVSHSARISSGVTPAGFSNGIGINAPAGASDSMWCVTTLCKMGTTNTWTATGNGVNSAITFQVIHSAAVTLSGALDRIRLTTSSGTDVFDAGTISIFYE